MTGGKMNPHKNDLVEMLKGGDRRSIGKANDVVDMVLADPELFAEVFEAMLHADPVVRMRAADAVEKISARHPEYLLPFKTRLLRQVAKIDQQEVRWHVAAMFSRLELTRADRRAVVKILNQYLTDKSRIVKTFAMQALADLALQDSELIPSIYAQIEELTRTGSPAMHSRGRKLLAKLKDVGDD